MPGDTPHKVFKSKSLGLLPTSFPATMEDAIAVTIKLDFKYLWIDQVCIDQSDSSDLHNHVAKVHMIYNCATVTIVAAAGHNANHGLPGVSIPRVPQAHDRLDLLADKPAYAAIPDHRRNEVFFILHWSSRAWTCQEGVLSRRRLVFTPNQTIFQCQCVTWTEAFSNDATPGIARGMNVFESLRAKD